MAGFVVRIWCRDCCGEDFQGCFDGVSELLNDGEVFPTREEADKAGTAECEESIWEYEVEEG